MGLDSLSASDLPGYGHGGLVMLLVTLIGFGVVHRSWATGTWTVPATRLLVICALAMVATELVLSTGYLVSPSYIDHIEPTIASIAQHFRHGRPVYPDLSSWTFHGLLYGPLLAEITSLGYLAGASVFGSKIVGWLSAWASVALIVLTCRKTGRGWPALVAASCALGVLASFGHVLIWNRADPLLLLFATIALAAVVYSPDLRGLAVAAFLAGASMDLKMHGPLYVAPALLLWAMSQPDRRTREWTHAALIVAVTGVTGAVLPLLPSNVSLEAYVEYLKLAAAHGLSLDMFLWNCTFLAGLWAPMVLLMAGARNSYGLAIGLFVAELVVTVIASKPGAGSHHLIPFLGFHAWLLQRWLTGVRGDRTSALAAVALASVVAGMAWSSAAAFRNLLTFDLRGAEQAAVRAELEGLAAEFPRGVMGVADNQTYPRTFLRPALTFAGTPQIEFGAFMDLRLSGVSDLPLVEAFDRCEMGYLYLPSGGAPFSMVSGYDLQPLFSDDVRRTFAARYVLTRPGRFFDVYSCAFPRSPPASPSADSGRVAHTDTRTPPRSRSSPPP